MSDSKYFNLTESYLCHKYSILPSQCKNIHRQYKNEWEWLGSNKTLFSLTGNESNLAHRLYFAHPSPRPLPFKVWLPGQNSRPAEAQSAFFFPQEVSQVIYEHTNIWGPLFLNSVFFLGPIKVVITAIKDRTSVNGIARLVIQTKKGKLPSCRSSPSLSRCQILTHDHNSLSWKMSFRFTD